MFIAHHATKMVRTWCTKWSFVFSHTFTVFQSGYVKLIWGQIYCQLLCFKNLLHLVFVLKDSTKKQSDFGLQQTEDKSLLKVSDHSPNTNNHTFPQPYGLEEFKPVKTSLKTKVSP